MSAKFDPSMNYRYSLEREWNLDAPRIGFIMLNPSTADATKNDPTIRRCIRFAQFWGYGAIEVVNLFAYRATNPDQLRCVADPIGSENTYYLLNMIQQVEAIVVAWGNQGNFRQQNQVVTRLLSNHSVYCLGMTRLRHPRHPLYVRSDTALMTFMLE